MSTIHTFTYKGKEYEIKVNNKVRKALNDYQVKAAKINLSPEAINVLSSIDLDNIKETESTDSITKLLPLLPYVDEFSKVGGDQFETIYVILNTLYGMSKADFEGLIEELEDEIGTEKVCELIGNINKEAFTQVEKLNSLLNQ